MQHKTPDRSLHVPARRRAWTQALALAAGMTVAVASVAATKTWTTQTDFNQGTLVGVTSTADGRLVLSITGSTFPVLWIANAGEDTLTKFDTRTNREIARYRTWFGPSGQPGHVSHLGNAYAGPAPSRTAVDVDGNAYVLNRHFDGRSASLVKILSNSFIDRDGNGVADTSADANADGIISGAEIKPMADSNNNGIIDPGEIQDERIAWAVRVPDGVGAPLRTGRLGRSLCIAPDGNLWVGLYDDRTYYKVRASDGATIAGPINVGMTPYGCLVGSDGTLYSASLGSQMGRVNTVTNTALPVLNVGSGNYGIALDNTHVYLGDYNSQTYTRVNRSTLAVDRPAAVRLYVLGLSVDGTGAIVTGGNNADGVHRFNASTGAVICSNTGQGLSDSRGVIADADDNVWVISLNSNRISKYDKNCNKLGTFPVGNSPYTYSDAAGLAARSITTRSGDWNVVYDSTIPGITWGQVNWNALVPAGGNVSFSVRSSNSEAGLGSQAFVPVTSGVPIAPPLTGRFIEIRARMAAGTSGDSPSLNEVTVSSAVCDVNADSSINKLDIDAIMASRNATAAPGDVRDADGDGKVTVLDARKCALKCTKPGCAL